jgi:resuscitation-promoting factor RpfA
MLRTARRSWTKVRALAAIFTLISVMIVGMGQPAYAYTYPWMFDNIRQPDGSWQGWAAPTQPPGGATLALTTSMDYADNLHLDMLNSQGLWDNIAYAGGGWQGWVLLKYAPPGGRELQLKSAADVDGNIYVFMATDSGLYYTRREFTTGAWAPWVAADFGAMPASGEIGELAVTVDGIDELQIGMSIWNGTASQGTLYHNILFLNTDSWQGWKEVATPGGVGVVNFAMAGLDGTQLGNMQILAYSNDGNLYHNIRYADGSWQGWAETVQPPIDFSFSGAPNISAAADYDGNVQFLVTYATLAGDQHRTTYHDIRYGVGGWQGWHELLNQNIYCDPHIAANPVVQYGDAHVDETCTDAPNALTG